MKTANHLSDNEIQQYALGEKEIEHVTAAHIAHCAHCSGRIALYQKMARCISSVPKEDFDFELAPLVLAQLAVRKPGYTPELAFLACVSIFGVLAGIGLFCYMNAELWNEMQWNRGTVVAGVVATCGLLVSLLMANLWKEYTLKIGKLNTPGRLQQYPGTAV